MGTIDGIAFEHLCELAGLPRPVPEYRFALDLGRQWRFDFAWPNSHLALEIDGGAFIHGRHHRPAGFIEDCVKLNEAVVLGWRVLRVTPQQVKDGTALDFVGRALAAHGGLS